VPWRFDDPELLRLVAVAEEKVRPAGLGGFYREVRIPNLCRGLPFGDAFGPDLPPARPR
jgi:hypothetical protein